ncbi:hypothetical protein OAN12_01680 [Halioglobus sp.]|nr:hypothetical protein [Halioglobus sp.]
MDMAAMKLVAGLFALVLMSGCAIGQVYDYDGAAVELPVMGSGTLGLGVVDRRPYIIDGDKNPDFVGLQRGGYGNPFDVTTDSGNSLASDMETALANELSANGFEIVELHFSSPDAAIIASAIKSSVAGRNVVLTVREWKTDAMYNFGLSYDISLEVFDNTATLLASAETSANKEKLGGSGMQEANSVAAVHAFSRVAGRLFNNAAIKGALEEKQE